MVHPRREKTALGLSFAFSMGLLPGRVVRFSLALRVSSFARSPRTVRPEGPVLFSPVLEGAVVANRGVWSR